MDKIPCKIIQIQALTNSTGRDYLVCLCADGSLWKVWPDIKMIYKIDIKS